MIDYVSPNILHRTVLQERINKKSRREAERNRGGSGQRQGERRRKYKAMFKPCRADEVFGQPVEVKCVTLCVRKVVVNTHESALMIRKSMATVDPLISL